jgi:hypothetical protein
VGLSLVASACGERSDEDKITDVVNGYVSAIGDGNGAKACSYLTGEARAMYDDFDRGDCPQVVLTPVAFPKRGKISSIQLNGPKATVAVREPGGSLHQIFLVKHGSEWKIDQSG